MNFLIAYPSVPCVFVLVIAMAVRWFAVPSDQRRTEWMLVVASLALPVNGVAEWCANQLDRIRPLKYDLYVYRIDALLGQPSFAIGKVVEHHSSLKILVSVSYGLLAIMIPLTFAAYLWLASEAETLVLVRAFLLAFFLAVPIYLFIPVCGPAFAFPDFPFNGQQNIPLHPIPIAAAPNGIPSVHMASALLICWFLRRWRWGLVTGAGFAALTAFATLGSGQHYLVDLICAVPYSVVVYRISRQKTMTPSVSRIFHAAS